MKPEVYEEELEKRKIGRERKAEFNKPEAPQMGKTGAFGKGGRLSNSGTYA